LVIAGANYFIVFVLQIEFVYICAKIDETIRSMDVLLFVFIIMITSCSSKLENPNTMSGRHHMTIKVSLDDGKTWPEKCYRLIDSVSGAGYLCMTKTDDKPVGILNDGSQADLIFQKFSIDEILTS